MGDVDGFVGRGAVEQLGRSSGRGLVLLRVEWPVASVCPFPKRDEGHGLAVSLAMNELGRSHLRVESRVTSSVGPALCKKVCKLGIIPKLLWFHPKVLPNIF